MTRLGQLATEAAWRPVSWPRWQDGGWPLADCTGLQFGPDAVLDRVTMLGAAPATLRSSAGRWILSRRRHARRRRGLAYVAGGCSPASARRRLFACDLLYE